MSTWTKLGSEFLTDPTLLGVSRGVRLLHVEALIWCNQQGTDGKVPFHILPRITDEPDTAAGALELVAAGLWADTESGYCIVDFTRDQPTAEDVKRTQDLAKERQRRKRQHNGGDHSLCNPKYCHVTRDDTRDFVVSHDTRTDRTDPSRKGSGSVPTEKPKPKSVSQQINDCSLCNEVGIVLDADFKPLRRCNHHA